MRLFLTTSGRDLLLSLM